MTIQEKIDNLVYRIKNNIHNYSSEDLFIIEKMPNLQKMYIKQLVTRTPPFAEGEYNLISDIITNYRDSLTDEEYEQLVYNFIVLFLERGEYESNLPSLVVSELGMQDSYKEKIQVLVDSYLKDPNKKFRNAYVSEELIYELLEYKRYDIIAEMPQEKGHVITEELYEKIKKEWPYEEYPAILRRYEKNVGIYVYSTKDSFEDLLNEFSSLYRSSKQIKGEITDHKEEKIQNLEEQIENIRKIIYDKIVSEKDLSYMNNKEYAFDSLINANRFYTPDLMIFPIEQEVEIAKLLYDRNCFCFSKLLISKGVITKEELEEKLRQLAQKDIELPLDFLDKLIDYPEEYEKAFKKIIDSGNLREMFLYYAPNDNVKRFIPYIIDSIKNNPIHKNCTIIDFYLNNYPEIFQALIEKGNIESIGLDFIGDDQLSLKTLMRALDKYPRIIISRDSSSESLNKVLYLINNGYIGKVINKYLMFDEEIAQYLDLILSKILEDVEATCIFINNKFELLVKNESYFNSLLGNPIITETIIEKINHNEELEYLYNDEIFQRVKIYYAKKHNLDLSHLEQMEKQLGPKIIRYIENDNLHQIINLNNEEFNKILSLFPNVQYDMVDLEAAHESLMQRLFVVKNPEIVSIFPNFIHACDDKNTEVLTNLRLELIINTKIDVLIEIIQKYKLYNIQTVGELLDLIIQKLSTPEREHYLDILHELTDNYISNARNNFRNNSYFDEKYPQFSGIFQKVLIAIDNNDTKELTKYIKEIEPVLDKEFFEQFTSNKELPSGFINPNDPDAAYTLITKIFDKIRDPNKREKYLPFLKEITDYYHDKKKESYAKQICIEEKLQLPHDLDERSKKNAIIKYMIINSERLRVKNGGLLQDVICAELIKRGIPASLAIDLFWYYRNAKDFVHDIKEIQKNIGLLVKVSTEIINANTITDFYGSELDYDRISKQLDESGEIRRIYRIPPPTTDLYQILLNLNIDLIRENLFKNEKMHKQLVELMKKKKIHMLPDNIKALVKECNISDDFTNIACFISFFAPILEAEHKRLSSLGKNPEDALSGLVSILIQAETYSSISSVYSQILGAEDAKLIKSNPGPNNAYRLLENNGRLKEGIKYTISNYKRQSVTVPPFDETFEFESEDGEKKRLEVIAGNFTDPSNLTHGERTGACMRIGGVGETLFKFCLTNPNGFHIRFEDPETHEYISRVSGFRNGNTVFLNELRYSCNPDKYSNLDVVEACRLAAEKLIELSKDSPCPIENVVIANQYAMTSSGMNVVNLKIKNNKEGLPEFYSDINTTGIVLATTAKGAPFVPISFNKSKVPTYQPVRSRILFLNETSQLVSRINRVASIKALLEGINYEDLDSLQFEDGLVYGIVSDDWYIYLDSNLEIHYDCITIDPRAEIELNKHLAIIKEMIDNNKIKKDDEYALR